MIPPFVFPSPLWPSPERGVSSEPISVIIKPVLMSKKSPLSDFFAQFPPFYVVSLWKVSMPSASRTNFQLTFALKFPRALRGCKKTFLNPLSHTTIRFFMNFMSRFSIDFQPKAAPTSSVCLYVLNPVSGVNHEQIRVISFTFFNNKNGWNTFMCSSSTLMIKPSSAVHYPSKKWNTPVPLFPQKSPIFSSQTQIFNNLLTNLLSSSNSVEILMFFCLKLPNSSNSVETPSVLLFSQKKHRKFGYLPEKY